MNSIPLHKAFMLIEPGPVTLITTHNGTRPNVMTVSWTMVVDFTPRFAITTGPWNFSYAALEKTKECVIAIPGADLIDTIVGVGTCSGTDTDKFERFALTPLPAHRVHAPLIKECLANIECQVVDIIEKHNIVVLEGIAAHRSSRGKDKRTIHAVGDGSFVIDGDKVSRRSMMRAKLPPGV